MEDLTPEDIERELEKIDAFIKAGCKPNSSDWLRVPPSPKSEPRN